MAGFGPVLSAGYDDTDSNQQVVVYRPRVEQLRNLERAANAQARDLARTERRNLASTECDGAGTGLEISGHHVDESRLAGAVAADQSDHGVLLDRNVDVARGGYRAANLVQSLRCDNACHVRPPCPCAWNATPRR